MQIKNILISQPVPTDIAKSPFMSLKTKYKTNIEFLPFIKSERVTLKEFRLQRIDVLLHTAIIFTSRHAIDNFFTICEEARITIPETMKYLCVSESIALYLQKYTVYRKRKISFGKGKFVDLMEIVTKNPKDIYLIPVSDPHKSEISQLMTNTKVKFAKLILSRTISQTDLREKVDLKKLGLLLLYSPAGVNALVEAFGEDAKQISIAAFGINTAIAVKEAGLNLVALAPTVESPSMVMAVDKYLKKVKDNETIDLSYIDEQISASILLQKKVTDKLKVTKVRKTTPKAKVIVKES